MYFHEGWNRVQNPTTKAHLHLRDDEADSRAGLLAGSQGLFVST